jgi:hypothetical protein
MPRSIEGFGGDGPHQVNVRTSQGEQALWVKRDLWFDRNDGTSWLVWAQQRSWESEEPPAEDDPEAATLGAIVVTDPVVMAFIEQLGELLVDPARFRHEPRFVADSDAAGDEYT